MIPYGRHEVVADDVASVTKALESDFLTTGPRVDEFEEALGSVVGGAGTVAVSSGTAALHTAYAAAGVGPGDDVVTSPLTFVATASAAIFCGGTVTFADVDDDTLTLDPDAVAAAVTPQTRVVAAIDYAGQPADLEQLLEVARRAEALLVEDASHALGATYRGQPVGSIADLTTFSFHPVKTVTTAEGGAVSSNDPHLLDRCRAFRSHGIVRDEARLVDKDEGPWHQEVHSLGLNYRMPDVLAALGTSQLRRLGAYVDRRRVLVARYRALLADVEDVRCLVERPDREAAWHLFPVRVPGVRRRATFEHLRAQGVGVQVHYLPVHWHPYFREMGYQRGSCPVAEAAYGELISLPLYPTLSEADQDRVVTILAEALRP